MVAVDLGLFGFLIMYFGIILFVGICLSALILFFVVISSRCRDAIYGDFETKSFWDLVIKVVYFPIFIIGWLNNRLSDDYEFWKVQNKNLSLEKLREAIKNK